MSEGAGYSGTPLAEKLGLKDGQRVIFLALPRDLEALATSRAFASVEHLAWEDIADAPFGYDLIHGFTTSRVRLETYIGKMMGMISPNGSIWISWPKRAAKVPTDLTEDAIRSICLPIGLVDIKVAAVDAVWSGLKLVIRKELRQV